METLLILLLLILSNSVFLAAGVYLGSRTHVEDLPRVALRTVFTKPKGELISPDNPLERRELDEKESQKNKEKAQWLR